MATSAHRLCRNISIVNLKSIEIISSLPSVACTCCWLDEGASLSQAGKSSPCSASSCLRAFLSVMDAVKPWRLVGRTWVTVSVTLTADFRKLRGLRWGASKEVATNMIGQKMRIKSQNPPTWPSISAMSSGSISVITVIESDSCCNSSDMYA